MHLPSYIIDLPYYHPSSQILNIFHFVLQGGLSDFDAQNNVLYPIWLFLYILVSWQKLSKTHEQVHAVP